MTTSSRPSREIDGKGRIASEAKNAERGAGPRKFKPYPAYKDSSVESLGEIPANWQVLKLKRVCTFAYGNSLSTRRDGDVEVYGSNGPVGIHDRTNTLGPCLIIGRKGSFGKINFSARPVFAIDTTFLVDRRFTRANIRWLYYVLSNAHLDSATKDSAIPGLDREDAYVRDVCICSDDEQHAVAAFLDRETASLDALVAKNERLVELLEERRTALITRAVTKGLAPNAPMKDSGVEWLGEIPAHWTAKHLRWAIMFQRGHDLPTDEREDGQVPIVSSSGISSTHSRAIAKAPGIVTGRYGTIGHFYLITQDYWPLNTTLYSIDLRGNDPRFLRYMLTHLSPLFLLNAVKSAVPGVDRNDIHPTRTAIPPLREQRSIADFLDAKVAEINVLVVKVRDAIDRLKELRTAFISAAVTGKIDVREEVA
jgi:restriction endonuclease S subunit